MRGEVTMVKEEKINGFEKYEIESAVRTLREAEAIKADPKMMEAIAPFIKKETAAMLKVAKIITSRKELREKAAELEAKDL